MELDFAKNSKFWNVRHKIQNPDFGVFAQGGRKVQNVPHERKPAKATYSKIWIPKFGCVGTQTQISAKYGMQIL